MHLKPISKHLRKKLYNRRSKEKQGYNPDRRRGGRSRSRFDDLIFVFLTQFSTSFRSPRRRGGRDGRDGGGRRRKKQVDLDWSMDY